MAQVLIAGHDATKDVDLADLNSQVRRLAQEGFIRIELCGLLEHADGLKGFTLDKTKYRMRFEDESEESVRVIIERKHETMTPEQQEACAKRAYEIFAASSGQTESWNAVHNINKTNWRDAVRDHHLNPGAIARKTEANLQERSVARAYSEIYQPPSEQPLVVPPITTEPASADAAVDTAPTEPSPEDGKKAKGK